MESANSLVAENRGHMFVWNWLFVSDSSIALFNFFEEVTDNCMLLVL